MDNTAVKITEKIQNRLRDGIRLENDVIHYIESMTGAQGPEQLVWQLENSEDSDNQSLYELIFYPAEQDQVKIEPLLEEKNMDQKSVQAIEHHLAEKEILTRVIFPDKSTTPQITVPETSIRRYVQRLKLTRAIPENIAAAIKNLVANRQIALRIRVKLRNARFCFSENITSFFCSCLEKMPVESEEDMGLIKWVVDFLEHTDDKTDIYTTLMDEKRRVAEMLRQASANEKQLSRQPVEALIMQGVNISCICSDEAVRQINLIDRIALAVFGRTEAVDPQAPVNLGAFDARGDIDKVIRILS
ncbi:MAG: hypothetical protein ACLFNW_06545 [Desulfobacterales bacterium]